MSEAQAQAPLRVFLCHSREDKSDVRKLYNQLRIEGIEPWFDEKDLLPGHNWQREIQRAIQATDVVLVCLSQHSVSKVGFVQREMRFALDRADEQPEGTIFIIPVRLEDCAVPDRLSPWQWVDFFKEEGFERLKRALIQRAKDLGRVVKDLATTDYYSVLISYSSKDEGLAKRLHADLQAEDVGCWLMPHDIEAGNSIIDSINQGAPLHEKLLLILSESSVASRWVSMEVKTALIREHNEDHTVLFPIRLDDSVMNLRAGWVAQIQERHIGDFRQWKDYDAYQATFAWLLRNLKAEQPRTLDQQHMANAEHLAILHQGVVVWNAWRVVNPNVMPDLVQADMRAVDWRRADFRRADLRRANLQGTDLAGTDLTGADLRRANLQWADLTGANLHGADLTGANLQWADLTETNLTRAVLQEADLQGTIFNQAIIGRTIFLTVDLQKVHGLSTIKHRSPSMIGIDTLYKSGGDIPESFLHGCGVPDSMIEYARALVAAERPIVWF